MRRKLNDALDFGRRLQATHDLQTISTDAAPDDLVAILDVSEVEADAQPKKITLSDLVSAAGASGATGPEGAVQTNSGGVFAGDAGLVYDSTTSKLTIGGDAQLASLNGGPLAGFRNLLINGNPVINQRSYVSGTNTTVANQYTLDRWRVVTSGQNITFSDSTGVRTVTAPADGVEQVVEADSVLGGTYTLSWTGTATATVNGTSVTSGGTVTLTGNATATVRFSSGTFSLAQFEVGSVATPFERRPIGVELGLCQRYYLEADDADLQGGPLTRKYFNGGVTCWAGGMSFPVEMRVAPTATIPTLSLTNITSDSMTLLLTNKGAVVRVIPTGAVTILWTASDPFTFDAEL